MKVAIYVPKLSQPEAGGEYYYYYIFFKKLIEHKTKHDFVFILNRNNKSEFEKLFGVDGKTILCIDALSVPDIFFNRSLQKILDFCKWNSLSHYFQTRIEKSITKKLDSAGIQFVYNLGVNEFVSLDIPFLSTVWDLAHRNLPFFPEVSSHGEFNKRETRYRQIISRAAFISVESESGKNDLVFYYQKKPDNIIVMPLFPGPVVNIKSTIEEQSQWLNQKNLTAKQFLFYPAQFWPHKNHINLLKAICILKKEYNIELPLVLTGSDKGNLEYIRAKIKELNLQSQVHILGFLELKEIYILYKNAFTLVMPTFLGPTTMPVLEALHLNCPIICSDLSGHREQLKDAALYFNPNNEFDIAEKIKLFYTDKALQLILSNNRNSEELKKNCSPQNALDSLLLAFDKFESIRTCWPCGV